MKKSNGKKSCNGKDKKALKSLIMKHEKEEKKEHKKLSKKAKKY